MSYVAKQLAILCAKQLSKKLDPSIVHAAKRCLIDWFAVTIAGSQEKQAVAIERTLSDELGAGSSWTMSGHRAPMRSAAFINGLASHVVEFDDIYAPGTFHPGSATIAAALSAATGLKRSGYELILGVVAGYEVSNRVARALGTQHYKKWHTTGTAGTIGAASAVSKIFNLKLNQFAHALATSTTMAAGLQNAFRGVSEIKPLHAGNAADAGFVSSGLARNGLQAAKDMFEAATGLGNVMSSDVDWVKAIGSENEFTILRTTIKNHGCCGHIFASLDGLLTLQREHKFQASDVSEICIGGYSATIDVTGNYICHDASSAKFCLPFVLASGLIHGSIRLDAYSHSRLSDPTVLDLMQKVEMFIDDEVDSLFPAQRSAKVWVKLKKGISLYRYQPDRVGDPDLPLSDGALNQKFMELTSHVLGADVSTRLLLKLWKIDELLSLDEISECLVGD